MTTLSVVLIALNESQNVKRCLDSIKDIADEIIFVDTGSEDNTKQLASCYTDKIFDFKWTGSFSDARNYAKSKATSEWILSLDLDEVVTDPDRLIKLINYQGVDAWALIQSTKSESEYSICYTHRLFRNIPEIRWANRIHEIIDVSLLENKLRVGKSQLILDHLPKDNSTLPQKFKGYIEQLKIDYENPLRYYYLGVCYISTGEFERGLLYLYQCLNDSYIKGLQSLVCMFISDWWLQQEDWFKAIEFQELGLRLTPKQSRGYVALAGLYNSIDRKDLAIEKIEHLIKTQSLDTQLINDVNYSQEYLQELKDLILQN